jgi:hypothetical protein
MARSKSKIAFSFFVTLLGLVLASPVFARAPLCSQSLLLDDFYVGSLHNLAEMKMNLDLQTAKGKQTAITGSITLEKIFAKKYSEFLQGTSSRFSEQQVRELLQEQIALIQQRNKNEQEKEANSRAEVQAALGPLKFVRAADVPIPRVDQSEYVSLYAPESNSVVLVRDQKELHLHNLSTDKKILLSPVMAAVAVRPNGKEIVVVTNEYLKIVDLDQSKTVFKKSLHELGISEDFNKYLISLNEQGTRAVISSNKGELLVLDLQTGAGRVYKGNLFGKEITSVSFADADHIFYHALGKGDNSLGIMNLDLKTGMVQPWLKTSHKELKADIFAGGKRVMLEIAAAPRNRYEIHQIPTTPTLDSVGEQVHINDARIIRLKSLPNSDVALVERFDIYNSRTNFEARDFRADDESQFHFIQWNFALGIYSNMDGRSVYILVHDRANLHLQVWNRE